MCTVTDDDGASGMASKSVRVVDVLNRDFENGFRALLAGAVANEWEPYAARLRSFNTLPALTAAGRGVCR